METVKVCIREFREKLASYLLESDKPLAITRHLDEKFFKSAPSGTTEAVP